MERSIEMKRLARGGKWNYGESGPFGKRGARVDSMTADRRPPCKGPSQ
jgi:hypothetical protein